MNLEEPTITLQEVAAAISGHIDPVFTALESLAADVLANLPAAGLRGELGSVPERQLNALERSITPHLMAHEVLIGVGFVATPGLVAGHQRYLYWWQRSGSGQLNRLRLNFDAESVDVYDYLQMEWFQAARAGAPRSAFGPYVDYTGAGAYVITSSVPVMHEGNFLGVAGADVSMVRLEPRLLGELTRTAAPTVLLNAERRVLASNTSRFVVGTRVPDAAELPAAVPFAVPVAPPVAVPNSPGWQVLELS